MAENINHPKHYNSGKIEVIEAIEDWGMNYHRGNAIKYVARAGKKDPNKEIEDLEKAVWYLKRDIERMTAKRDCRPIVRPNDMNEREHDRLDKSKSDGQQVFLSERGVVASPMEAAGHINGRTD